MRGSGDRLEDKSLRGSINAQIDEVLSELESKLDYKIVLVLCFLDPHEVEKKMGFTHLQRCGHFNA